NIHRRHELGEPTLVAAITGSREIGFAVIATTLTLISVFVPISFLPGDLGRLFREFGFTLAAAVGFSALIALTLTPMLASRLPEQERRNSFAALIDRFFKQLARFYERCLRGALRRPLIVVAVLVGLIGVGFVTFLSVPAEFTPQADNGRAFVSIESPEGSSFDYIDRYARQLEAIALKSIAGGEVERVLVRVPGQGGNDLRTGDINTARAFLIFSDWDERQHTVQEIMQPVLAEARKLPGVRVSMGQPGGLGRGGLQSPIVAVIGGPDYEHLAVWSDQMLQLAQANPGLANVQSNYKERKPQIRVSIDRDRAADLGISLESVGRTLETVLGSRIVTTYIDRGREYNVILQGRDDIRETTTDLTNIRVRSGRTDELIPLSSVVHLQETSGTIQLSRFDRLRAIKISADLANGYTMGEAVKWFQDTVGRELPEANLDWDGQTREFTRTGQQLYFTFLLALAVVYLVLAAQFESFVHPIIIMVTVPLALLGAVFGLKLFGLTINIFSQIAVIMLIGIAAKNGVLIVEFANQLRDRGLEFTDAVVQAAVTRLRPVLMTSLCTAFGALPLMLASGAGAEQRRPIGIVVFFGMTVAVFLTLFAVPTVYGLLARRTGSPQHVSRLVDRLMGGGAGGVGEAVAHDARRD
ncbi:MAG TPA: efflux RND transporter permease subunit, partial [Rhodanobacteraceae bacterium]|nr:efflux RND transporter permease subunit [Rhodanobacteraceae bacterium]